MADLAKTEMVEMESAGRVVPLYKGDYSNSATYTRLDVVLYNNSSYIAKQTTTGHTPPSANSDAYWQLIAKGIIDADVSDATVEFTQAATRANIESGEDGKTLFGKIKKWFADLKPVAFTGSYNDLSNKPTIPSVGNGTLTIQKNGANVQTFSANQASNATANITVPTGAADVGAVAASKVLTTKEQINANTDANNVAGAVAVKNMVSEINSNLIGLSTLTLITQIESPREATSITVDIGYWRNIYKKLHVNIGFNYGNHAIVDLYPEDYFAIRVVVGLTVTYTSVRIDLPTDHTIKFETDTGIYANGDKIYVFGVK